MRLYDTEVSEIDTKDGEQSYRLSVEEWGDDGISFYAYLSRPQLERLQEQINYALVGRMAEWGDLYAGTGIEDPDAIIF